MIQNQRTLVKLLQATNKLEGTLHFEDTWMIVVEVGKLLDRSGAVDDYPMECAGVRSILDVAMCYQWNVDKGDHPEELSWMLLWEHVLRIFGDVQAAKEVLAAKEQSFTGKMPTMVRLMNESKVFRKIFQGHVGVACATYLVEYSNFVLKTHVIKPRDCRRATLNAATKLIVDEMNRLEAGDLLGGPRKTDVCFGHLTLKMPVDSVQGEIDLREAAAVRMLLTPQLPPLPAWQEFYPNDFEAGPIMLDKSVLRLPTAGRERLCKIIVATPPTSATHYFEMLKNQSRNIQQVFGLP